LLEQNETELLRLTHHIPATPPTGLPVAVSSYSSLHLGLHAVHTYLLHTQNLYKSGQNNAAGIM